MTKTPNEMSDDQLLTACAEVMYGEVATDQITWDALDAEAEARGFTASRVVAYYHGADWRNS